jgi:hypothetical protein
MDGGWPLRGFWCWDAHEDGEILCRIRLIVVIHDGWEEGGWMGELSCGKWKRNTVEVTTQAALPCLFTHRKKLLCNGLTSHSQR